MRYASDAAVVIVACSFMAAMWTERQSDDDLAAVDAVLSDFHAAAADADGERYFSHFTSDAVFLGTDPGERWSIDEFKSYAEPHFDAGTGWTYTMRDRHIAFNTQQTVAWFDEVVMNEKYGACRGTGVLVKQEGVWRIAQYNLTMPIPNDLALDVVALIRTHGH